jgi:uncharacterized protein (TIGR02757 family)
MSGLDPRLSEREERIKDALDEVRARCAMRERLDTDPVRFVHEYADRNDRELVALLAACLAFGNVKAILAKMTDLLARLGDHPSDLAGRSLQEVQSRLRGWKHRVFRDDDVARLLVGARRVQRTHGSLGALFAAELRRTESLREALGSWCDAIRSAGGLRRGGPRRGPSHLLPDPRGPSGSKRLLLFLRWMVRAPDGIDLGLWSVDPAALLVPVDVHIHKLALNLGFTRRRTPSWRTTEEITRALARFDRSDPTKYDFSLCHMGMLQRCPSRRDAVRCEGCGVKPVCIRWVGARTSGRSAGNG